MVQHHPQATHGGTDTRNESCGSHHGNLQHVSRQSRKHGDHVTAYAKALTPAEVGASTRDTPRTLCEPYKPNLLGDHSIPQMWNTLPLRVAFGGHY